jgi:lactoylglutathione lyase
MISNTLTYVMVNVTNMQRSIEFYRDKLGLPVKFESPGWSEFSTGTTTLALHLVTSSRDGAVSSTEPRAGTCSIGLNVDDIQRKYEELMAVGVRFVLPPTLRKEEGIKLAVFIDPDGLPISIAESVNECV